MNAVIIGSGDILIHKMLMADARELNAMPCESVTVEQMKELYRNSKILPVLQHQKVDQKHYMKFNKRKRFNK